MTDDQHDAALRQLSMRGDRRRPLSSEAQARIEARLDTAFSDAAGILDVEVLGLSEPLGPISHRDERDRSSRPRWWLAPMTAAAATVIIVVGLVVASKQESAPTAADSGLFPTEFPVNLLQPGTRWSLTTQLPESGALIANASVTIAMDDVNSAQARVRSSDVPPRQFLGAVLFDATTSGNVLVPLVLLDPERNWVDCDATLDVRGSGTATCGGDVVAYVAEAGATEVLVTPAGRYEAQAFTVDWSDDTLDEQRTRLWISPLAGPVRIEIDDADTTRTFNLGAFDAPNASTPATP